MISIRFLNFFIHTKTIIQIIIIIIKTPACPGCVTFNPKMIAQGLYYHIWGSVKNFLSSLIFFFGYSIVLTLGLLTILKIILPQYVGIFFHKNGGHSIGFDANSVNATEVLGYWFIPIGIFLTIILYMGLTRLLKVLKKGSKYKEIKA